ncbi:hypothetical protein B0H17DRAFT_1179528 [Mycena rosella]|uniref:Uncharacterized protein n=1 Tax=Mycena rosella TaxID=1033263 RepID=A0AAD7GK78_MYCRO|nr:hypothetical protein B0H17DRAFT_1179528 [Mycena rosella]
MYRVVYECGRDGVPGDAARVQLSGQPESEVGLGAGEVALRSGIEAGVGRGFSRSEGGAGVASAARGVYGVGSATGVEKGGRCERRSGDVEAVSDPRWGRVRDVPERWKLDGSCQRARAIADRVRPTTIARLFGFMHLSSTGGRLKLLNQFSATTSSRPQESQRKLTTSKVSMVVDSHKVPARKGLEAEIPAVVNTQQQMQWEVRIRACGTSAAAVNTPPNPRRYDDKKWGIGAWRECMGSTELVYLQQPANTNMVAIWRRKGVPQRRLCASKPPQPTGIEPSLLRAHFLCCNGARFFKGICESIKLVTL